MAAKFWVGGTGNLDGVSTAHIANSSNGAGGAAYPVAGDTLELDANSGGGTVTMTANLAVLSLTIASFTGTFNDGGFAVTTGAINFSGTGVRTITKSGAWILNAAGTIWDSSTSTNLTFTDTGSTTLTVPSGTSSRTITLGSVLLNNFAATNGGNLSLTGSVNDFSFPVARQLSGALIVRGNYLIGASTTFSGGVSTITFAATSGTKTIQTNGRAITRDVTFDGVGGTWQLLDALTIDAARTLTLVNGAITGAFNVTVGKAVVSGTGVRSWTQTAGTIELTGSGTVWDSATATNLTTNFTGTTIKLTDSTATAKTFISGGGTAKNIWVSGTGTGTFDFTGNPNFVDLKIDSGRTARFTGGTTVTAATLHTTGATITGITAANFNLVITGGVTFGLGTMTISRVQASPANTFYAGASSTDSGNNNQVYFADAPISKTASTPWSSSGYIAQPQAAPWESFADIRVSQSSLWESLQSLNKPVISPWEALAGIAGSTSVPWSSGSGVIGGFAIVPWEALAPVRRSATVPFESRIPIQTLLIEQALYRLLTADAGVSAFVEDRVTPGFLKQTTLYPAIAYRLVSREHFGQLGDRGSLGLANSRFRFFSTVRGPKGPGVYADAKLLAEALRLCLQGYAGTVADGEQYIVIQDISPDGESDSYDDATQTHQVVSDFDVFHSVQMPVSA